MMVEVGLQLVSQLVFIPLVYIGLVDIEQALRNLCCLMQNFQMVRETDSHEFLEIHFDRHWQSICGKQQMCLDCFGFFQFDSRAIELRLGANKTGDQAS